MGKSKAIHHINAPLNQICLPPSALFSTAICWRKMERAEFHCAVTSARLSRLSQHLQPVDELMAQYDYSTGSAPLELI